MANLASRSNVKTYLSITGTGDDALIDRMLSATDAKILRFCDRRDGFVSASHTEYLDGNGAQTLQLAHTPITAVSSVTFIFTESSSTSQTLSNFTVDGYPLNASFTAHVGILAVRRSAQLAFELGTDDRVTFPVGFRNTKVVYTGGEAVPANLEQIAIEATAVMYCGRRLERGLASESLGATSRSMRTPTELDDWLREELLTQGFRKVAI